MVYRKGELSPAAIDKGWPHQVALGQLGAREQYHRHEEITVECAGRSRCDRGHAVFHDGSWWNINCFADPADAAWFLKRFGGELFDPRDRGRGTSWARWHKGRAAERDRLRATRR